jgi:hypothetical protein
MLLQNRSPNAALRKGSVESAHRLRLACLPHFPGKRGDCVVRPKSLRAPETPTMIGNRETYGGFKYDSSPLALLAA